MRRVLVGLAVLVSLAIVGAVAFAHVGSVEDQVIHTCVSPSGSMQVVEATETCVGNDTVLDWNAVGIQGVQGTQGVTGAQGAQGVAGASGVIQVIDVPTNCDTHSGPTFSLVPFGSVDFTLAQDSRVLIMGQVTTSIFLQEVGVDVDVLTLGLTDPLAGESFVAGCFLVKKFSDGFSDTPTVSVFEVVDLDAGSYSFDFEISADITDLTGFEFGFTIIPNDFKVLILEEFP